MNSQSIAGPLARKWWYEIMSNVVDLLEDAELLYDNERFARARSMVILASEELARAVWLSNHASVHWHIPSAQIELPESFWKQQTAHREKIKEVETYAVRLHYFWSDGTDAFIPLEIDSTPSEIGNLASKLNLEKMGGFYVDLKGSEIQSPADISGEGIQDHLRRIAQAAEMHLIDDHTSIQYSQVYEEANTQGLQFRLLPYAHPEEFGEWFAHREGRKELPEKDSDG